MERNKDQEDRDQGNRLKQWVSGTSFSKRKTKDDKPVTKLIKRKIKCKRRYITIDKASGESMRDIFKIS